MGKVVTLPLASENQHPKAYGETGFYRRLGRSIKESRLDTGLSQAELGEAMGYDRSTISVIESGGMRLAAFQMCACAMALKKDLGELLGFRVVR